MTAMKKWGIPGMLLLVLSSCQQEINYVIPEIQQPCRITNGYYYGGSGGLIDSTSFVYNNGRLIRIDGEYEYITYEYSGNNISLVRIFDRQTSTVMQTDSVKYNSSNKITQMVTWYYDPFFPDTVRFRLLFNYNNDRLDRVNEYTTWFSSLGEETDTTISIFHHNAAGNMDKLWLEDPQGFRFDSVIYVFDNNPNYFNAAHPHFFLFDPFFQLQVGLTPHLPYFYSTNNVTRFLLDGGLDYPIQYGIDSLNNVTSVMMMGDDYVKYKYECP
jgi:hypothetical protein